MNRPRRKADATHNTDETFEEYHANLKLEAAELKKKLRWRNIWTSSIIVPDADKKDLPEYLRPLVKLQVRGTFDRSKNSMPNSLYEKRKKERVMDKLRKQGIIPNEN